MATLLLGETNFTEFLSLAFTGLPTAQYTFRQDNMTDIGLEVDKTAADKLDAFVCGGVKPARAQSGVLLWSLLQCGHVDVGNGVALLMLNQIQDPVFD